MAESNEVETVLAEYTSAVVAERTAWRLLHDRTLAEHQRESVREEWMAAAQKAKVLGARLKAMATGTNSRDDSVQ